MCSDRPLMTATRKSSWGGGEAPPRWIRKPGQPQKPARKRSASRRCFQLHRKACVCVYGGESGSRGETARISLELSRGSCPTGQTMENHLELIMHIPPDSWKLLMIRSQQLLPLFLSQGPWTEEAQGSFPPPPLAPFSSAFAKKQVRRG